jgi:hypothetical protein
LQTSDERLCVEGLGRTFDRTETEEVERFVREMKSVERRDYGDPCTTLLGDGRRQRTRERRLARARWPGDAEEEPPTRQVDCGEQLVREASNELVRIALRRCSRQPRD